MTKVEPGAQKTEVEMVGVRDKVKPGRMDPGGVGGVEQPKAWKSVVEPAGQKIKVEPEE